MGVAACVLFGLLAAWITRSMHINGRTINLIFTCVIGLTGGLAGLIGITLGWGDINSFNLYNVLLSIMLTAALMALFAIVRLNKATLYEVSDINED